MLDDFKINAYAQLDRTAAVAVAVNEDRLCRCCLHELESAYVQPVSQPLAQGASEFTLRNRSIQRMDIFNLDT